MKRISRRDFLKLTNRGLAAVGLAALTVPVVSFFYPPELEEIPSEPVLVCPEGELEPGQSKIIQFGRYPALVIHTEAGLRGYSAVCTHFACIVKWDPEGKVIFCPCHEGYFEPLEGTVTAGPPPSPLLALSVQVIDGQIYVGGEA